MVGYEAGGSGPGAKASMCDSTGWSLYDGALPRGRGADVQLWLHLAKRLLSAISFQRKLCL